MTFRVNQSVNQSLAKTAASVNYPSARPPRLIQIDAPFSSRLSRDSQLADTLALSRECLSDGGHMCIVVGDFRHKARYYMFHADIAHAMESRGFTLKGIKILYQRHKRVFP